MEAVVLTPEIKQILHDNKSSLEGLTTSEAKNRIEKYGLNVLTSSAKKTVLLQFLSKFANPLIIILVFASFISLFSGEVADFIIIMAIIVFSVCIDFYQEFQSEKAADKLKQKVSIKATVMRDNEIKEIPVSHITVGDIVQLTLGDVIPADLIILQTNDLHVDESTLTGESFPAQKDLLDKAKMGTTVVNGEALAIVTAVGRNTEFGHIAEKLAQKRPETDFEKGIRQFGSLVMKITLLLVLFIFLVNIVFHRDLFNSFLFAIALAVGLTPELLPMIVTVNLSKGAMRMSHKGVIVKHLPSIQNFGSMNILCTDKTGTITENKIRLEKYENVDGKEDKKVLQYAFLNSRFQSSMKNPLDEAVLAHHEMSGHGFKKVDEIPFDFIRRRLSVVIYNKETYLVCKGAPESVWEETSHYEENGEIKPFHSSIKEQVKKQFEAMSNDGFRVLAIAYRKVDARKSYTKSDEKELIFLGLTAFLDPPKHEVKAVLKSLNEAGVSLKILTGDNELVTKKVCQELDIPVEGVVLGSELIHHSDAALIPIVLKSTIFARLTPDQKDRIITALRKLGNVVGYMGDGVNDAVSLRTADIGISVENAVDVAKESADIILVSKSLAVLKDGIIEGRKTFANTMKYIFMGMGSNFGNMFSVSIGSLFLPFLPMLPVQILLNNLIYDISQLFLPVDNVDGVELQKPQRWDMKFIKKFIFIFGPISSLFDFTTFIVLLGLMHATVPFFRTGWFMESIATQSLIILAIRTRKVPFFTSNPSKYIIVSALGAVLFGIFITQGFLKEYFQFVSLPLMYWTFLVLIVGWYFVVVEIAKYFFYRSVSQHLK
jgi:Mg2+-importing ATPase